VRQRSFRIGPLEIIAITVGLLAACYLGWVIQDVRSSGPDGGSGPITTSSATPSASVQVAAPEAPTGPPPLGPFREAASSAHTILVVGDSTGEGARSWVHLLAQDLGAQRQVTLHGWDEATARFDEKGDSFGKGGDQLEIWNLSYRGVDADYPDHLGDLPRPDAVLVNVGHDRSARAVGHAVVVTTEAISERWGDVPTALVLQNPSAGDDAAQQTRAIRRLTTLATEIGYPVIDVYGAFEQADDPTLVDADSRPTDEGSRLWAETVEAASGIGSA
jgi:hypothetical protein